MLSLVPRFYDPNAGTDVEGQAFSGAWSGPQVVVTHRAPPVSSTATRDVLFVDSIERGVAAATDAAGDKYVNVLGADIARQCIAAGLLDEVFVCIAPLMLGGGVPLFASAGGPFTSSGARVGISINSMSNTSIPFGSRAPL